MVNALSGSFEVYMNGVLHIHEEKHGQGKLHVSKKDIDLLWNNLNPAGAGLHACVSRIAL